MRKKNRKIDGIGTSFNQTFDEEMHDVFRWNEIKNEQMYSQRKETKGFMIQ